MARHCDHCKPDLCLFAGGGSGGGGGGGGSSVLVVETTVSYSPYKYTLVLQATAAEIMAADSAVASFTLSGGGMMDGAMVKGPVACEYNSSGEAYFVIPVSNMYAVFSAETLNDYPTCEIDDK